MKKVKRWDTCKICGEKIEKKPGKLWCRDCRKIVDRELRMLGINFLPSKYK